MPLDDITLKALAFTQQNIENTVKDILVTRTLQGTQEQVENIRLSELDDAQKRDAFSQISQEATFALAQAGATPAGIKQIASAITGPVEKIQNIDQALLSRFGDVRARGREALQVKTSAELQEEAFKASLAPGLKPTEILKQIEVFKKSPGVAALVEGLSALDNVDALLDTNFEAGVQLAKIALVKGAGEKGRLSDQDLQKAEFEVSAIRKVQGIAKRFITGSPLQATIEDMKLFARAVRAQAEANLRRRVDKTSGVVSKVTGIDKEQFKQNLLDSLALRSLGERLRPVTLQNKQGEKRPGFVDPSTGKTFFRRP